MVLRIANYLRMAIDYCLDCKSNNIIADSQISICRKAWKRGIRLWRRFFAPPLVSELPDGLRSNANPILRLGESQRGVRILSYRSQINKKQPSFLGSVVLLFGAGRGIRTPVAFGLTVFKTASL